MLALKKNEAKRLLFDVVSVALIWILGDWMLRGRGRSVHQILSDSFPFVLGATTVTIWRFFRERRGTEVSRTGRRNAES